MPAQPPSLFDGPMLVRGNLTVTGSIAAAGGIREYRVANVLNYGADPTGVTDSTAAFVAALAAAKMVIAAEGTYAITGITIPPRTTLQLVPGAQLRTSGSIFLDGADAHLLGPHTGISASDASTVTPSIVWTGASGGTIVKMGTLVTLIGGSVIGIVASGAAVANVVAYQFGEAGAGGAWSEFRDLVALEVLVGFYVKSGFQVIDYKNLLALNANAGSKEYLAGSVGLKLGTDTGMGAITASDFEGFGSNAFLDGIVLGTAAGAGGGSSISFSGKLVIEAQADDGACGIRAQGGGPYFINGMFLEGPGASTGTTRGLIIGSATGGMVTGLHLTHCFFQGFDGGTLIEGFGWDGLSIVGCQMDFSPAGSVCFRNTGGGLRRMKGYWAGNVIFPPSVAPVSEFRNSDTTGFIVAQRANFYFDGSNNPWPLLKNGTAQKRVNNTVKQQLCPATFFGKVTITQDSKMAIFGVFGTHHAQELVAGAAATWTAVPGTASHVNVGWDAGLGQYVIENLSGGDLFFGIQLDEFVQQA